MGQWDKWLKSAPQKFFSKLAGQGQNTIASLSIATIALSGEVAGQAPDKRKKERWDSGTIADKHHRLNSLTCPTSCGTHGTLCDSHGVGPSRISRACETRGICMSHAPQAFVSIGIFPPVCTCGYKVWRLLRRLRGVMPAFSVFDKLVVWFLRRTR